LEALLSVEETAPRLGGLSKYTIHAWLSSGKLRRTKVGSRTMISESDLQAFIEECNPAADHATRRQAAGGSNDR
jgi:excisionase family DNA binding protein